MHCNRLLLGKYLSRDILKLYLRIDQVGDQMLP